MRTKFKWKTKRYYNIIVLFVKRSKYTQITDTLSLYNNINTKKSTN